jgi:hypothetical protein
LQRRCHQQDLPHPSLTMVQRCPSFREALHTPKAGQVPSLVSCADALTDRAKLRRSLAGSITGQDSRKMAPSLCRREAGG